MLFENPDNVEIKEEFNQVMAMYVNPFTKMRLWLVYEVLEIEALQETFEMRRSIQSVYKKTCQSVEAQMNELESLERGSYTLNSLLSSNEAVTRRIARMKTD